MLGVDVTTKKLISRRLVMAAAMSLAAAVLIPSAGQALAQPRSSACTASQVQLTTATNRSTYIADQHVGVSTTLTNVSSRSCAVNIQSCVGATITNASGGLVWSAVPLNALCALYIVHQTLLPGRSVSRAWTWNQHVCLLVGQCPGRQVPAGTYTAQGHWGMPYGDAAPTTFRIT